MTWRMAKSLEILRKEINGVWPHRDRTSDGGVGDASHQARPSKHNPGANRVVEARDFDEDVSGTNGQGGRPLWDLVQHLLKLARDGHPALGLGAHLIYEGRIWSAKHGWRERPYTGPNAHEHHLHVAVADAAAGYDSTESWDIARALRPKAAARKPDRWLGLANPPMVGQDVLNVQNALVKADPANRARMACDLPVARYGRETADLIALFQRNRAIAERGVGPATWSALRKVAHA